jgi:hypothetical protein
VRCHGKWAAENGARIVRSFRSPETADWEPATAANLRARTSHMGIGLVMTSTGKRVRITVHPLPEESTGTVLPRQVALPAPSEVTFKLSF